MVVKPVIRPRRGHHFVLEKQKQTKQGRLRILMARLSIFHSGTLHKTILSRLAVRRCSLAAACSSGVACSVGQFDHGGKSCAALLRSKL